MAHTHGTNWNNELIEQKIKFVMKELGIKTMPTQSMTQEIIGDCSLNNAISRSGGYMFWANKLGINHLGKETLIGREFEEICMRKIENKFDYDVEQMHCTYPYDLLVNSNIKIDVKVSKKYKNKFEMYTFNLEKKYPTCDLFVCYCISDEKEIIKTYIIPSAILTGKTQLSVGVLKSKYDKYLDDWNLITKYNKFYKTF